MKTKEELAALKQEYAALNEKLKTLTPEEILQVTGGLDDLDKRELAPDSGANFANNSITNVGENGAIYGGIINNM